jgi:hypothetical protein
LKGGGGIWYHHTMAETSDDLEHLRTLLGDTTDNLMLDYLRALRMEIAEVKTSLSDINGRLASIESYIATLHGELRPTPPT